MHLKNVITFLSWENIAVFFLFFFFFFHFCKVANETNNPAVLILLQFETHSNVYYYVNRKHKMKLVKSIQLASDSNEFYCKMKYIYELWNKTKSNKMLPSYLYLNWMAKKCSIKFFNIQMVDCGIVVCKQRRMQGCFGSADVLVLLFQCKISYCKMLLNVQVVDCGIENK